MVQVIVQGPIDTNPSSPSFGDRPAARVLEHIVHERAGLGGRGGRLDSPAYIERDENGDGIFERKIFNIQDIHGNVVRVVDTANDVMGFHFVEDITYTMFGEPIFVKEDRSSILDYNNDGNVDPADVDAYFSVLGEGPCGNDPVTDEPYNCDGLDLNGDGNIDPTDVDFYYYILGDGEVRTLNDNRFLYRGYMWDPFLRVYHVRNRVYDPYIRRWLQPDPAGRIDGVNLYQYCGNDPWNGYDPYGLWDWDDDWVESAGRAVLGGFGIGGAENAAAASGFADGAHDGRVVTVNVALNTASFGAFGMTRSQLEAAGRLRDPGNEYLDYSEAAGHVIAVEAIAAAVVGTGGLGGGAFASTMGGAIYIGATAGVAADVAIQSYNLRNGTQASYNYTQTAVAAATGGMGGAAGVMLNRLLAGRAAGRLVDDIAKHEADDCAQSAAQYQRYKDELAKTAGKPTGIKDDLLREFMEKLYRPAAKKGSGSTADALRHELATGELVGGSSHAQKVDDAIPYLKDWLRKNPGAADSDRRLAEQVLRDLENARNGN